MRVRYFIGLDFRAMMRAARCCGDLFRAIIEARRRDAEGDSDCRHDASASRDGSRWPSSASITLRPHAQARYCYRRYGRSPMSSNSAVCHITLRIAVSRWALADGCCC